MNPRRTTPTSITAVYGDRAERSRGRHHAHAYGGLNLLVPIGPGVDLVGPNRSSAPAATTDFLRRICYDVTHPPHQAAGHRRPGTATGLPQPERRPGERLAHPAAVVHRRPGRVHSGRP
ncbi:DUF4863 family protein [Streptomyces spectabilis]|uniref:DUF4863 family protein n=1 Tax=Streptomyces spectabilis TaxID=68270 RepID=A0A5P2XMX2_STRST|nr:DUF4863 family protein [Streptomyces spectabilis]